MSKCAFLVSVVVFTGFVWGQVVDPTSQPINGGGTPTQNATGASASGVAAAKPPKKAAVRKPSLAGAIRGQLNSSDPEVQAAGIAQLQDPKIVTPALVAASFEYYWSAQLLEQHQYDLIINLCDRGLTGDVSTPNTLASLTKMRYESLLAQKKFDDALAVSKSYYNLCPLQDTREAIRIVSEALINARGKTEPNIVSRFQQQQTALSQPPAAVDGPPLALPTELGENILTGIKVDGTIYDDAIKQNAAALISYKSLTAQGNLLLAADRPKDAEKAFQTASDLATDKQLSDAITNMARAIRAEDGSVGRANAYILSLRTAAPAAKPSAAKAK